MADSSGEPKVSHWVKISDSPESRPFDKDDPRDNPPERVLSGSRTEPYVTNGHTSGMPNECLAFNRFLATTSRAYNDLPDSCSHSGSVKLKFRARVFLLNWDPFHRAQSR